MSPERAEEPGTAPAPAARTVSGLLALYAALVAVRFLASLLLSEPILFSDELTYKSMALGFFSTGRFAALSPDAVGVPTGMAYILYPLVLSASFLFGANFLTAAKLINALLINAALFPFFGILKDFLPRRRAALAAALPLLLPTFGYSAFLMAENVYLPLAALSLFLVYRQITRGRLRDAVLSSASIALLFLAKHQALSFLLAVPAAAAALAGSRRARREDPRRARDLGTGLAVMLAPALAALALAGLFAPEALRRLWALSRGVFWGAWLSLVRPGGSAPVGLDAPARAGIAHLAVILLIGLVPILGIYWAWRDSRHSPDRRRAGLAALALSFLASSLGMTLLATAAFADGERYGRLHGRFYASALAFVLAAFAALGRDVVWTKARKRALAIGAAAALGAAAWALPGFLSGPGKPTLAVDFPEIGWAAYAGSAGRAAALALFAAVVAVVLARGRTKVVPAVLLAVLVAANVLQYRTFVRTYLPERTASRTARAFAVGQIGDPKARVAVFGRGEFPRFLLTFWQDYRYTRSAELPRDGVLRRAMIPRGTDYAVVFGDAKLDFGPFRAYRRSGCAVLALADRVDVLGDFSGLHRDAPGWAWTGPSFAYAPDGTFRSLVLILNKRQAYFSRVLEVESDQGVQKIRLDGGIERIELPYSRFYRFRLDRVFSPRKLGLNPEDARPLGISLREAFIVD